MDLYEFSTFFREISGKNNNSFRNLFNNYHKIKITNSEIDALRENYFLEQIKNKLEVILIF